MKAALYEGPKKIKLIERPDMKAERGEVILRIKYCGICGTDVHAYLRTGVLPEGIILGHENVGTVAEVGPGVEKWKVGDRVIAGAPGPCGECYYCIHGEPTICVNGMSRTNGIGRDGGMAEYMRIKDPKTMLFKIPDHVSFEDAVLFDIAAVAIRGIRYSKFQLGDTVIVTGAGAIGLCAIQLLSLGGAKHITVLQPSPKKREFALKVGANVTFNPAEEVDIVKKITEIYDGIGADIAVECAGSPDAFKLCLSLIRSGGQVLVLGNTEQPTPISESELIMKEIEMKATLAYSADDINIFLELLAQKRFKTEGMVSDIIKLDDIVEKGVERLVNTKGLIKVLLAP